ncbi:respiratory chain complex I subunit 1 family protein [Lebetimonas sp. JH292]|uniref:respiratory chain complex I subunit 1 family protein n=1 Tax=Lebetimonas sp. JH292 TaxID=990068 RepID=UPI0004642DBD|nr:NADH-quinone oxidoreductase subunit H [Lebetimonas sp. JH292]
MIDYFLSIIFIALISPFLTGMIKSIKMFLLFKKPLSPFQPYIDIAKLFKKEVIYSKETSLISKTAPFLIISPLIIVLFLLPPIYNKSFYISFMDAFTITGLMSLSTFFLMLLGLDSASSFGGIGSSREAFISAMVEPAMILTIFAVSLMAGNISISKAAVSLSNHFPIIYSASFILSAISFFILLIAENGRIPVDNPETHLELTMVHEAMVLDASGANLALIELAGSLKFGIFASLFATLFMPFGSSLCWCLALGIFIIKLLLIVIMVALVEVNTAKLRLFKVPNLLAVAIIFGFLSLTTYYILGA